MAGPHRPRAVREDAFVDAAEGAEPLLPKGTILKVTTWFDTTPANKNVVDPRNWSGLGQRSIDNMAIGIMIGVKLTDQEFQQEMARRREQRRLTEGGTIIGCPLCGLGNQRPVRAGNQ